MIKAGRTLQAISSTKAKPFWKKGTALYVTNLQTAASACFNFRPNLKIRYSFFKASYHQIFPSLPRADAVTALNCGFIFYKSWDESLPLMLKNLRKLAVLS